MIKNPGITVEIPIISFTVPSIDTSTSGFDGHIAISGYRSLLQSPGPHFLRARRCRAPNIPSEFI